VIRKRSCWVASKKIDAEILGAKCFWSHDRSTKNADIPVRAMKQDSAVMRAWVRSGKRTACAAARCLLSSYRQLAASCPACKCVAVLHEIGCNVFPLIPGFTCIFSVPLEYTLGFEIGLGGTYLRGLPLDFEPFGTIFCIHFYRERREVVVFNVLFHLKQFSSVAAAAAAATAPFTSSLRTTVSSS
jgi:hypothetical protein